MKTTTHTFFIFTLASILMVSCGQDGSGGAASQGISTLSEGSQYRVILETLNGSVTGNNTTGTSILRKDGEEFLVKVYINDSHAGVSHLQSITSGGECPGQQNDVNADGIIDAAEGEAVYGTPVLYLDGDLTTQDLTDAIFPRASSYSYQQTIKLDALALTMNQNSSLEGRTMVIHGVRTGSVPATAVGVSGQSPEASLPIACGKIVRVDPEE